MHRTENRKLITLYYEGVEELIRHHDKPSEANRYHWSSTNGDHGGVKENMRWYGTPSVRDVIPTIRKGHPEAARRMEAMMNRYTLRTPKGQRHRRRARREAQGDELDIHAVNNGRLDRAWRRSRKVDLKRGRARRITLIFQAGVMAGQDQADLFYTPVAAAVLAQKLSSARVATEIIYTGCSRGTLANGQSVATIVRVKPPEAPLNIGALAATTLGGYYRLLCFGARMTEEKQVSYGLGRTTNVLEIDPTAYDRFKRDDSRMVIVPLLKSDAQVEEFITETIKEVETHVRK